MGGTHHRNSTRVGGAAEHRLDAPTSFQDTAVALAVVDLEWRVLTWSDGAEQLLGWTADDVVGRDLFAHLDPIALKPVPAGSGRRALPHAEADLMVLHRDGRRVSIRSVSHLVDEHTDRPARLLIAVPLTRVSELQRRLWSRARQQTALAGLGPVEVSSQSLRTYLDRVVTDARRALDATDTRLYLFDDDGLTMRLRACASEARCELGSVVETSPDSPMARLLEGPGLIDSASAVGLVDDGAADLVTLAVPVSLPSGAAGALVATSPSREVFDTEDLAFLRAVAALVAAALERIRVETQLARQAVLDPLTGLPNRMLLIDRIEQGLSRLGRTGMPMAVVFCDLDRFKRVNDTLGHEAGDVVLRAVARLLENAVRTGDTVARLGGDEFVIVCDGLDSEAEAHAIAARVMARTARPLNVGGREVRAGLSMGIALTTDAGRSAADLLQAADAAMYRAKQQGRGSYVVYDEAMDEEEERRRSLEQGLREALDLGQLLVHLQPRISLGTRRAVGVEALARWHHPSWGPVEPDQFVPVAEEAGLIQEVGAHILDAALAATAWLRIRHPEVANLAVNLSAAQLSDPGCATQLAERAAAHGIPLDTVTVEITEAATLDLEGPILSSLHALRAAGVKVSIDDFGTGSSSLAYLTRVPADEIKIDRSLVAELGDDRRAQLVVAATVAMGHALGLRVVAEGVETSAQVDTLIGLECDEAQGWIWSGPLPATDLVDWLDGGP